MDRLRAAYNAWLERTNPLAGLSVHRARSLYDAARAYGSPRLQYTYDEIELTDPVLLTCTERRAAAIAGMGWKFRARAASDATLAQEQRDALQTFANDIENLTEALEHLDLAFFRGFAHVQPIWDGEKVQHITLLKSWNFLRDPDGTWYWNPECRETPRGLAAIGPDARLVTVTRRRAIDYPALSIHIRHALGERDWGRFVERYGIPPADITMAPNATEADRPKYENTADAAKDGRNIVLPNGASVTRAGDTRGVNPFLDFCEYQAKQILILATGGTLATLSESGSGTLAGNAQENVWRQIVARDGGVISDALNRSLFRPFLAMKFPNRPTCVDFELGADKTPSAEEVFDLAAKARSAGYLIEQSELEEASGYTLEKDAQQPQPGPAFGLARARDAAPPLQKPKNPLQNAPKDLDGQGEGQEPAALLGAFSAGFEKRLLDAMFKAAAEGLDAEAWGAARPEAPDNPDIPENPVVAAAKSGECRAENPATCPTHGTPGAPSETTEKPTHTPEQQKRIEEYLASVDQSVVDFVEKCKSIEDGDELSRMKWPICDATPEFGARVKDLTGLDTTGWKIELRGERARHLDIRHGAEGKHDHSLADIKDVGRLGYVMQHFDSIDILRDENGSPVLSGQYNGKDGKPSPVLEARMRIDGTYAVQHAVPDSKWKKIYIVSARIEKAKEP